MVSEVSMQKGMGKQTIFPEGYMVKKGHRRTNWKRRYFVLRKRVLYYYETEEMARRATEENKDLHKGTIPLAEYTVGKSDESITNYNSCFLFCGFKKEFLIRAESPMEYEKWWAVFQAVAKEIITDTSTLKILRGGKKNRDSLCK
jgi:hypothetical protein